MGRESQLAKPQARSPWLSNLSSCLVHSKVGDTRPIIQKMPQLNSEWSGLLWCLCDWWGWVPLGNVRQVTCIPMANCYLKCQEPCLKHNDDFAQSVTTLKFESHINSASATTHISKSQQHGWRVFAQWRWREEPALGTLPGSPSPIQFLARQCGRHGTKNQNNIKIHKTLLQHLPITSWTVSCKGLISSLSQISLIFLARSIFISRMMPHGLIELIINHAFWQLQVDRNCCMHLVSASHCGHWCRTMQNALRGTKKFQHPEGMQRKQCDGQMWCATLTLHSISLSLCDDDLGI
jgi:hypothetical protein